MDNNEIKEPFELSMLDALAFLGIALAFSATILKSQSIDLIQEIETIIETPLNDNET